ncbi:hypothetical protein [Laspinema olomoucense]|uniref:hypothetical protein n=1 Tax=Laspinema olomoucense TaxID=3231600 RepID=UPI0021BA6BE5|nr:hypothetical protein [Laspinema sp. D3a]MCT7988949.1 hypothetical protein [Laspinema sp. D3a]
MQLQSLISSSPKKAANNSDLLFAGIFGHIKRETGKEWKEHQTEEEYENAKKIALKKLEEIRKELRKRLGQPNLLDLLE